MASEGYKILDYLFIGDLGVWLMGYSKTPLSVIFMIILASLLALLLMNQQQVLAQQNQTIEEQN